MGQGAASQPADAWDLGAAYEPYVGRWSSLVAERFLGWLAMPAGQRWADVGCGTGALTDVILSHGAPARVAGIDRSAAFLTYARRRVADEHVTFAQGDMLALPLRTASQHATVSGLAVNFVPDPEQALREMTRTTQPGGRVALYVWDYAEGMQMMRYFWDAATALDPAAADLDEGRRFPICETSALRALFHDCGLAGVAVDAIEIDTVFPTFEEYWVPFLGGQGPAPAYVMSLPERQRARLRGELRRRLPISPDGSIPLRARAWAAKGTRVR